MSQQLEQVKCKSQATILKYDDAGRLSEIRKKECAVGLKHDSRARLTKIIAGPFNISFEHTSGESILQIVDSGQDKVEWHFRANQSVAGVIRKDTGILWTRSSDGRIIQMAIGSITGMEGGYRFQPNVLIGTNP